MKHNIISLITFFFDKLRITIGDSRCPLYQKCSRNDEDNDCCVSFRGRTEIGGNRTLCYSLTKKDIKENKEGIIGKVCKIIVNQLVSIGGEREDKNTK